MIKSEPATLNGAGATNAWTLKSWFDYDSIAVRIGKEGYRIKAEELLKLIQRATFTVHQKQVHAYLEVHEPQVLTKKCPNNCNQLGLSKAHEVFADQYLFCPYCGTKLTEERK